MSLIGPANSKTQTLQQQQSSVTVFRAISELCLAMSTCGMKSICLGSLNDHDAGRQYSVFSQPEQKIAAGETTLHDVLHASDKPRLKRSERFQVALAVSSSHLQLHSTRWARKQWEAVDIRFPKSHEKDSGIMFDKPYVSADFNEARPGVEQAPSKTDRSFACLGIMLLELLFGTRRPRALAGTRLSRK